MPTRREVLTSFAAAAVAAATPRLLTADSTRRAALEGVGLQLYTLRDEMRRDVEGTIRRIAAMGYQEIEWWGEWGRSARDLQALLSKHGLRSPAAHIDPRELEPAQRSATFARAREMGHRHLIVAWMPPNQRNTERFRRLAQTLNEAGREGASQGIRTGYHNHDFEFVESPDGTLWDLLLRETDPAVVDLELDCYWAFKTGRDPAELLRRHGDRITHLHVKDSAGAPEHRQVDVGSGVIDWKTVLAEGTARRVQHAFVEHDDPTDAWATLRAGRRHLRTLGY